MGVTMSKSMTLSEAMKEIKERECCECDRQAKGLVGLGSKFTYYCKKHLHAHIRSRELAEC